MMKMKMILLFLLAGVIISAGHRVPVSLINGEIQNVSSLLDSIQIEENRAQEKAGSSSSASLASGVVNTNIFTLFNYNGSQVYIYSSVSNDASYAMTPQKWVFYYVPIMAPMIEDNNPWVWAVKNEVRVRILLGDTVAEGLARKAIEKKYDAKTVEFSKYWDVAPLMIDSFTAYVIERSVSPVAGVEPYQAIHPNSLIMILRFRCSTAEQAYHVAHSLSTGENEIEIAFQFAGFYEASTNFIAITGDQIKSVSSKTVADGGNTNAEFIHRSQASKFVSQYNTNVKKMIYIERSDFNSDPLSSGLQETFISLMQQAMNEAAQEKIKLETYEKVWSSSDLNPNRITSEMNRFFTYNKTATELHHDGTSYFDVDIEKIRKAASSTNVGLWSTLTFGLADLFSVGVGAGVNVGHESSSETVDAHQQTNYQTVSDKTIYDSLQQNDVQFEWTGEKFQPKSFNVFKIHDLTDRLQTAIISKQMIVDRNRNSIIRVISTMNTPQSIQQNQTLHKQHLTGEVKLYAGSDAPPPSWLLCDGSKVSRIQYQRLFAVIGERFGPGDGIETFNIPDFRGRIPLGVDADEARVKLATEVGKNGGSASYRLKPSEIPPHRHDKGSLVLSSSGSHNHGIYDPGHDHGGHTGEAKMGGGGWGMTRTGHGSDQTSHRHSIQRDYTGIQILTSGDHTHAIFGETGSFGGGEPFPVMPPYQTVNYIIYAE